jgi:glycosyltransferase involved in cell wall biosynthesis
MRPKLLFLYTELAEYFFACVKTLTIEHKAEVHIVRWAVNKEAPFQFSIPDGVTIYEKQNYSRVELITLVHEIKPDLIFCSGWIDKDYLAAVRSIRKQIPVVVGMDNHWFGKLKQQLARIVSPFTLKLIFTHAFVAGVPQKAYAQKLSFKNEQILTGYYSADVALYVALNAKFKDQKAINYPKRFLYVGRYIKHKGIEELWLAFEQLQLEEPNEWEIWCVGTGPLENEIVSHPKIKHFGFVQPSDIGTFIRDCGVFVLPSHFEPWGVVVHEFAAAGFPLLCSKAVGAATSFLEHGVNGYIFDSASVDSLKFAMKQIMHKTDEELRIMGEKSLELGLKNTPSIWANKLMKLLQSKN